MTHPQVGEDVAADIVTVRDFLTREIDSRLATPLDESSQALAAFNRVADGFHARAGGWLPIETAPKDGTYVLVWVRGEAAVTKWINDPFGKCWGITTPPHPNNPDQSRTYSNVGPRGWEGVVIDAGPSHWQPLPASPAQPSADRSDGGEG